MFKCLCRWVNFNLRLVQTLYVHSQFIQYKKSESPIDSLFLLALLASR